MKRNKTKIISAGILTAVLFIFFLDCLDFISLTYAQEEIDETKDKIESSIDEIQKKLEKETSIKQQLEKQLNQIQYSVNATQHEINKTQNYIDETKENISRYEKEIERLEERNNFQKKILTSILRQIYYTQSNSIEILAFKYSKNNHFLGENDNLTTLERKIMLLMDEIKNSKLKIEKEKKDLQEEKEEYERLLSLKKDQQKDLLSEKQDTQINIIQRQATIEELNAKLTKLRSDLSSLLGKSFNAKDIESAASFASKVTDVRKDFIMGMLVVESDLGRFTGGCTAEQSRMSKNRLEIFKDICKELGYNWKKQKVSCPPKSYSGTGGAMGVAQFMSDTWLGYKSQIASVTGHNPPDPWNLTDGVVAMALKLAKGGATKKSGECNAAKLYLSGTTSSKYDWYCQKVLYWADNYERLLN